LQSHLSENLSECAWVKTLCPDSDGYGDAYLRFGQFGGPVPTIMAHCVWSGDKEIRSMAEQGVYMAHCPQSNTNLASGIAPVRRFLNQGVPVGLGSDMAGGCHTSIFRAMADAIQMSKLHWLLQNQQEPALTLAEAFFLATKGGGSFFGKVGGFEEGYAFDALVLDDTPLAAPYSLDMEDRLARVTYLSDNRFIIRKYVQGRLINKRL
jgi:guanine deaminase